jgi:hypothetical protein
MDDQKCPMDNPAHYFKNGKWRGCTCVAGQLALIGDHDE